MINPPISLKPFVKAAPGPLRTVWGLQINQPDSPIGELRKDLPLISFTRQELRVFDALLDKFGYPRPKRVLYEAAIRCPDGTRNPKYKMVDVLISRIGQTLAKAGWPITVESIWGIGHRLIFLPDHEHHFPTPRRSVTQRWNVAQKRAYLDMYRQSVDDNDQQFLSTLRREYPEITGEVLEYWKSHGLRETKI